MDAETGLKWSCREKLAIASYVLRSGEQRWTGVGRLLKPLGEPGRPPDWFSPKHCAQQYSMLLENSEEPRRTRGDRNDSSSESINDVTREELIVRKLTQERIEELKRIMRNEKQKYKKLKQKIEQIESGELDDQLDEMIADMEKKNAEPVTEEMPESNQATDAEVKPQVVASEETKAEPPSIYEESINETDKNENHQNDIEQIETEDINQITKEEVAESMEEQIEEKSPQVETSEAEQNTLVEEDEPATIENTEVVTKEDSTEEPTSVVEESEKEEITSQIKEAILDEENEPVLSEDFIEQTSTEVAPVEEEDTSTNPDNDMAMPEVTEEPEDKSLEPAAEDKILDADKIVEAEDSGYIQSQSLPATPIPATTSLSYESYPNSPALSYSSEMDHETAANYKAWRKSIMILWKQVASHRYASLFLQPVSDDIAPNYSTTVYRVMDLSTLKKNVENGIIRTTAEFQRDLMLMFQNAMMYNNREHDVYKMAYQMQEDVMDQVAQFLATQLMVETNLGSKQPTTNKTLRRSMARRSAANNEKVGEARSKRVAAIEGEAKFKRKKQPSNE